MVVELLADFEVLVEPATAKRDEALRIKGAHQSDADAARKVVEGTT